MAAEEKGRDDELRKEIESLRAKVVELEDKLSKLHITDEEWKTYRKVAAVLAGHAGLPESVREDSGGQCDVTPKPERKPPYLIHLFRGTTVQVPNVVVPTIIISGFGDLGS